MAVYLDWLFYPFIREVNMETILLTVLHPKGQEQPLIELSPVNINDLHEARQYWREANESPDIVLGLFEIKVPDDVHDFIQTHREDSLEAIEGLLTALYRSCLGLRTI